jgi:uncharacterized protein (DUF427 family)
VWDYPRPPRLEAVRRQIEVILGGETIALTLEPLIVLETSHPPGYYLPSDSIVPGVLTPTGRTSFCEFKGVATYFSVSMKGQTATDGAWTYQRPSPGYEAMAGYVSFYPAQMEVCLVDGEYVEAQPGGFYGGWITSSVAGPSRAALAPRAGRGENGAMTLTMGRGPFGHQPAGTFNFDPPDTVVFVEPLNRRVRGVADGGTVVDSDRVRLVYESRTLPHYAFPAADVSVPGEPEPHADGYVRVAWDAVDAWYEEDEEVFVHPRDPYHRIDTLPTSRRVRVLLGGEVLADSTEARALYETGLPIRYYLPVPDVRQEVLAPSQTVTQCAYKGSARHWSVTTATGLASDVAWTYDEGVRREAEEVRGRIAFYNERTDIEIDGVAQERPRTPWYR